MAPSSLRPPWGWTGPVRVFLIALASLSALALSLAAGTTRGPADPPPALILDPNTAPAEALTALPGLGPVLSGRIVEERSRAPFRSLDDLDRRVRGIGPAKVAALRPYL